MADTKMMICRESFWANIDGDATLFHEGRTLVSADSDVYLRFPDKFKEAEATYGSGFEQATAAPGERKAVKV